MDKKKIENEEIVALRGKNCKPCEKGTKPMEKEDILKKLGLLEGWGYSNGAILRTFKFRDHYKTMAFVNAVAWVSHREHHYPMMGVGDNTCCVRYWTRAIDGISENDFICAAKVNNLLAAK